MNFRMNDLENFIEVAACKTMSEAAKKLGISQPALSESIKRLESDLGEVLLYRARSGITLTPAGNAICSTAKNAISLLLGIEAIQKSGPNFGSRTITIGCHPTVASYFLPGALKRLEKVAPDYKIILKHDLSRNIQSEIQQGLIDIGIVVNPSPSPDLVIREIGKDEVAVWGAKNARRDKVFCSLDLVQTQSILRKWKGQPVTKINTNSLELIVRLVEAGLGLGIVPTCTVNLLGAHIQKLDSTPVYQDSIHIVYRPEFGKSQIEHEVVRALRGGPQTV